MAQEQQQTAPPVAKRVPHERTHHGDTFVDEYEWLRDPESPETLAHLEAENAYTEARTAHLRQPARGDLRRDQGAHPGDRPVGALPDRRLVVLRPLPRGQAVRRQLPLPGGRPRRLDPADPRGRRRDPRRAGADRRRRAGRGPRVLLPRRGLGQPRRPAARVQHRRGRQRALPAPGQGPGHRRDAARRGAQHARRRHLGPARAARCSTPPPTTPGAPTRSGGTCWAPP